MKTNPIRNHCTIAAFTLVELLVVIAIIAMLTGIAATAVNNALVTGRMTRASGDARQIFLAVKMFSTDHDGNFPGAEASSSNEAFRELFPAYMRVEANFVVPSSPIGKRADNKVEPPTRALERGENHWAYVAGLNEMSHPLWPVIVDSTDGSGGYSTRENEPGGTWSGRKGIVIRCDGGATISVLRGTGDKRYLPRFDDDQMDALDLGSYMGQGPRLLEPER